MTDVAAHDLELAGELNRNGLLGYEAEGHHRRDFRDSGFSHLGVYHNIKDSDLVFAQAPR